jgi:uncharacterized protein (TIGR03067 family)
MKRFVLTLALVPICLFIGFCHADDSTKPISAEQAVKRVNEKVCVEMPVQATKNRIEKRGEIYLDSQQDFHDAKNLGVIITKTGATKYTQNNIGDPAVHFMGKIIRVNGTVIIKENRPRIEVDDPKQVEIVGEPDTVKAERKQLSCTWQAVSYALNGQKASDEDMKKVKLIIDRNGDTRAQQEGKTFIASTTGIDPTRNPKFIDIAFTEGDPRGRTSLGIYKLEGDVLTICRSAPGQPRPERFSSEPGSGHTLMSYRREKVRPKRGRSLFRQRFYQLFEVFHSADLCSQVLEATHQSRGVSRSRVPAGVHA